MLYSFGVLKLIVEYLSSSKVDEDYGVLKGGGLKEGR